MFLVISALKNYCIYGGDATDAYAHSPADFARPTFVSIDDQYFDWYEKKYGKRLDRKKVLPVLKAIQGHPESGRIWEEYINNILASPELGFTNTTHDRCIFRATFKGHEVYLLKQVDDMAISSPNEEIAKEIFDIIGRKLQLRHESSPPFEYLGLINDFNGIDVNQCKEYIEIACPKYIDRILRSHNWDKTPLVP